MNDDTPYAFWLCFGAVILLVAALLPFWPYGYYRFLRIFVCAVGAYVAYKSWRSDRVTFAMAVGLIALVFNPIVPFRLTRELWSVLNLGAALAFALAAASFQKKM